MADMAIIPIHIAELFCNIDMRRVRDAEYAGDEVGKLQLHFVKLLHPVLAEIIMDCLAHFPDLFR